MVCLFQILRCQILLQKFLQYLCKYHLFSHEQWSCLYQYHKLLHFLHTLIWYNQSKIHILQFYLDFILMNLNKKTCSLIFEFFSFQLLIDFLILKIGFDTKYFFPLSVVTNLIFLYFLIFSIVFLKTALLINFKKSVSKLFSLFVLA